MRVKLTAYPSSEAVLFERGVSTSNNYFRLLLTTGGYLKAQARNAGSVVTVTSSSYSMPLGVWVHVAGAFKQNNSHGLRVFRNGFEIAYTSTVSGNLQSFSSNPKIGGGGFAGKIDEVHVRNAMPASFTIEGSYTKGSSTLGLWHFNTGSGTTESDDDYTGEQQTATLPSSGCWTNASGEFYPARYEYIYTYDKVGNRTVKYEFFVTNSVGSGLKWTCTYNGLNQLTQQNKYSTDGLTLERKWLYTYDADGNLTTKEKQTSAGVKEEKWVYSWNPRNQMTLTERFTGTNDTYAGKVAYRYCLSCDSVLSERIEYSPTSSTTIIKWWRYEYDGLNCLRVDEKYDTTGGSLDANDPWRTLEVTTHKPGSLGALIGKRVYTHTNNDATPDSTNDYTYTYDAVGNVLAIYNANSTGRGNELTTSPFNGSSWSTARAAGITEHQTGKWIDPFTGLYFFHSRWYDSAVGRFVGKTLLPPQKEHPNTFCFNNPLSYVDKDGQLPFLVAPILALITHLVAAEGTCAALASLPGMIEAWVGEWYDVVHDDPEDPASGNKWPRTHCMWNCYMERWCAPGTARAASYIKEIIDLVVCLISGDRGHCWSALQEGDWQANQAGRDAANDPKFHCCAVGCDKRGWPLGGPEKPSGPWWKCHDKWFCIW